MRRGLVRRFGCLVRLWGGKTLTRAQIGDADAVLDLFRLLFTTVQAVVRSHHDLVIENLLLLHQLAVLTRPTRSRRQARLHLWDKLLWILARRFCTGWRSRCCRDRARL